MISISKSKLKRPLLTISMILIIAASAFYLGNVLAAPSPSIGQVVTPGVVGSCDYFISMDVTTPIAHLQSSKGGTPGDNIVGTTGQDMGAFLNSITVPGIHFCFGGDKFKFSTSWVLQSADDVEGIFNKTLFQANTNNLDIVSVSHPVPGGATTINIDIFGLSINTGGFTNINGFNFNESLNEVSTNSVIQRVWVQGAFNYVAIMDGNEASILEDIYICCPGGASGLQGSGDISFKVNNGAAEIINVQYMNPSGTGNKIHLLASQFLIDQSTFDSLQFERQTAANNGAGSTTQYFTSGDIMLSNDFLANGDPGGISRITVTNGQTVAVLSLTLLNDEIELGGGGGLIGSLATGSNLQLNQVALIGNYIFQGTGSGYWFTNGGSSGTAKIFELHWNPSNRIGGTITNNGFLTTGLCSAFAFGPEPQGLGGTQNFPALPVATGLANARQNCSVPWPMIVYMNITSSSGVVLQTNAHIIDFNTNTDKLVYNQYNVLLYPGDKIYFATNLPYAWWWYGTQW